MWSFTATSTSLLEGLRDRKDELHWGEFHRRYTPPLTAMIRRTGFHENDAADIAQECLIAFAESYHAGNYDPSRGKLRSFLVGIAKNKIRDHRRRLFKGMLLVGEQDALEAAGGPAKNDELESVWDQEWRSHLLRVCLDQVRLHFEPKSMQIFDRHTLAGEDAAALAEEFGVSRNHVFKIKSRVLEKMRELRQHLEETWE